MQYFDASFSSFAIHQHELVIGLHMSPPFCTPTSLPSYFHPLGCHRALASGSPHRAENSHWLSILHMVICMFQCYFKPPHPVLHLLCPKVCFLSFPHCVQNTASVFLCCPAYKIVSTIFLDSIHMHCYCYCYC